MRKSFLSIPVIVGFVVLLIGAFHVRSTLTQHNFGFSRSVETKELNIKSTHVVDEDLRVLVYNVHGLPHSQNPWCDNLLRIGEILRDMRAKGDAPHVIALQEGFHEKIHDLIRLSGYPYAEQGPTGPESTMTSGLWILSEYPIRPKSQTIYDTCATWDCWASKGVQHVTILAPGGLEVDVYNTHMNANNGKGDFWTQKTEIVRAKLGQIRHFHQYFNKTHNTERPTLAVGDFNFRPGDVASGLFKSLSTQFFNVADVILGAQPGRLVDHQFFIPAKTPVIYPASWDKILTGRRNHLSDHSGVLVNYRRQ